MSRVHSLMILYLTLWTGFILLFAISGTTASDPACTQDDIGYMFGPCEGEQRKSISYWKRACTATADGPQLQAPRSAPCQVQCNSGTFYSAKTLGCDQCEAGTYLYAGRTEFLTFSPLPQGFVSHCSPKPCKPWVPSESGSYLHSNNQTDDSGEDRVTTILSYTAEIVNSAGGKLTFSYRTESEEYFDGLKLVINGNEVNTGHFNNFLSTGVRQQWQEYSVALKTGTNQIDWTYLKDQDNNSPAGTRGVGLDRAFVRDIRIDGTHTSSMACTPCPAGYMSHAGSRECTMCPRNTKSLERAPKCEDCSGTTWSPAGASECLKRKPCDPDTDYIAKYSACVNGKRTKSFELSSTNCDNVNPPQAVPDQSCDDCLPGMHVDGAGKCVSCPDGYKWTGSSCSACPAGTAGIKSLAFDNFDVLNNDITSQGFTTKCTGLCRKCANYCTDNVPSGWEAMTVRESGEDRVVMFSGYGHGGTVDVVLEREVTLYTNGFVHFTYFFSRQYKTELTDSVDVEGAFTIDAVRWSLSNRFDTAETHGTILSHALPAGTYKLRWSFRKNWVNDDANPTALVLRSLTIYGDQKGGATKCQTCDSGKKCPAKSNRMIDCEPGTHQQVGGQATCNKCTGNSVTTESGRTWCEVCPFGTEAAENNNACKNLCRFRTPTPNGKGGLEYDLNALRDKLYGPFYADSALTAKNNRSTADAAGLHRFFFRLCDHVNAHDDTCKNQYGNRVENAFVCQRITADRSYSLGDWVSYQPDGYSGLGMNFASGDMCSGGVPRTTNLTLRCVPPTDKAETATFVDEKPKCHYNFVLYTPHACPICTAESFSSTRGECEADGFQLQTWFKMESASRCYGGVPLPEPKKVPCNRCQSNSYDFTWSDCVDGEQTTMFFVKDASKGCVDDGSNQPPLQVRKCTKGGSKNTFIIVIIAVVVVASVLGLCLWRVTSERNKLRVQYQMLSRDANNHGEMQSVPTVMDDDDDDGEHSDRKLDDE